MKKLGLVLFFTLITLASQAQVKADRPGIANTSYVVGKAKLQVESGFKYSQFNPDADGSLAIGELYLRTGIYDRVEFQVGLNSYVSSDAFNNGFENTTLGLRWNVINVPAFNLPPQGSSRTDPYQETKLSVTIAGNLNAPIGGAGNAPDETSGNIGIYADFEPENPDFTNWSISSNLTFFVDDIDVNDDYLFTFTPTYNFDERHSIYFGYAGFYGSDNIDRYFLEFGLFLKVRNLERLQVDLNSGYDLNNDGFFIGAGAAVALY